jgi:FAD:protein FMN transferase
VRIAMTGIDAPARVAAARATVLDYHRRLSRFRPDSELCALNADPRATVPASALLRDAVRAGLWAARASAGLVDPCLLDALERAGYARSFTNNGNRGQTPPGGQTPLLRPAAAREAAPWRRILVGPDCIARPRGLRLDLGGSGKGHVADLVARGLGGRWLVDCGGDLRVGGSWDIDVAHPWRAELAGRFNGTDGAVATSSVVARAWEGGHHLLDPATGLPAHTGVVAATAIAPTTLAAETLAKTAVLRGPDGAREVLGAAGGLFVHADGDVELVAR